MINTFEDKYLLRWLSIYIILVAITIIIEPDDNSYIFNFVSIIEKLIPSITKVAAISLSQNTTRLVMSITWIFSAFISINIIIKNSIKLNTDNLYFTTKLICLIFALSAITIFTIYKPEANQGRFNDMFYYLFSSKPIIILMPALLYLIIISFNIIIIVSVIKSICKEIFKALKKPPKDVYIKSIHMRMLGDAVSVHKRSPIYPIIFTITYLFSVVTLVSYAENINNYLNIMVILTLSYIIYIINIVNCYVKIYANGICIHHIYKHEIITWSQIDNVLIYSSHGMPPYNSLQYNFYINDGRTVKLRCYWANNKQFNDNIIKLLKQNNIWIQYV